MTDRFTMLEDEVLFPGVGLTRGGLIDYYVAVAETRMVIDPDPPSDDFEPVRRADREA